MEELGDNQLVAITQQLIEVARLMARCDVDEEVNDDVDGDVDEDVDHYDNDEDVNQATGKPRDPGKT